MTDKKPMKTSGSPTGSAVPRKWGSSGKYELTVLKGPNAGALVQISDGTYRIGEGGDADIVLYGDSGCIHTCLLHVQGRNLELEVPAGPGVTVDGILVRSQTLPLSPGQCCVMGDHKFRVEPVSGVSSSIPTYDFLTSEPSLASIFRKKASRNFNRARILGAMTINRITAKTAPVSPAALLVLAAVSAVIAAGLYGYLVNSPTPLRKAVLQIEAFLAEQSLSGKITVSEDEETVVVTGYVGKWREKEDLIIHLQSYTIPISHEIFITEQMVQAAGAYLKRNDQFLTVYSPNNGALTVEGITANARVLDSLLVSCATEIPGIDTIINNSVSGSAVFRFLNPLLVSNDLLGKLSAAVHEGTLVAYGVLDSLDSAKWHSVKDAFADRFGMPIRDHFQSRPAFLARQHPEPGSISPHSRVSVTKVGRTSYVNITESHKYFPGSVTGRGSVIQEIDHDRVIIRDGGKLITFRFGEEPS